VSENVVEERIMGKALSLYFIAALVWVVCSYLYPYSYSWWEGDTLKLGNLQAELHSPVTNTQKRVIQTVLCHLSPYRGDFTLLPYVSSKEELVFSYVFEGIFLLGLNVFLISVIMHYISRAWAWDGKNTAWSKFWDKYSLGVQCAAIILLFVAFTYIMMRGEPFTSSEDLHHITGEYIDIQIPGCPLPVTVSASRALNSYVAGSFEEEYSRAIFVKRINGFLYLMLAGLAFVLGTILFLMRDEDIYGVGMLDQIAETFENRAMLAIPLFLVWPILVHAGAYQVGLPQFNVIIDVIRNAL